MHYPYAFKDSYAEKNNLIQDWQFYVIHIHTAITKAMYLFENL